MIGSVVGTYRIVDKIGEGGMGAVYKGIDLMLEREVAVKALRPELSSQPDVVARFREEAVTLAKLNHFNIATLFSFFRQGDLFFMVMEFVDGQTLDKLLEARGAMSCEQAVPLFCQVLEGIDHAHRSGIIHRDIKPTNMMVTNEGPLKVLDFGIARMLGGSRMTKAGNLIGTIEYMSPEQIRGQETDARSDIYSLGMLLYEMLTGRVPFASDSEFELMKMQVEQMPTPPRVFAPHIPEDVEWAIMCATAKDPEKRFQTAAAFREAIVDSMSSAAASSTTTVPDYSWSTTSLVPRPSYETKRISKDLSSWTPATQTPIDGTPETATQSAPLAKVNRLHQLRTNKLFMPMIVGVFLAFVFTGALGTWLIIRALNGTPAEASEATNQKTAPSQPIEAKQVAPPTIPTAPSGMVYVPGGEFMMGRNESEGGDEYESPAHRVSIKPFFIDTYEVTRDEYKKCVDEKKCSPPQGWVDGNYPEGTGRQPVTGVTWDDANAYAQWSGKRLPTEEEWEFAARGKDGWQYPWGNEWKSNHSNADKTNDGMKDVGTYQGASPFGAFDMVGNAWEWTAARFEVYPGGKLSEKISDDSMVLRGGSWESPKSAATTTYRNPWPGKNAKKGYQSAGLRCAKDIS